MFRDPTGAAIDPFSLLKISLTVFKTLTAKAKAAAIPVVVYSGPPIVVTATAAPTVASGISAGTVVLGASLIGSGIYLGSQMNVSILKDLGYLPMNFAPAPDQMYVPNEGVREMPIEVRDAYFDASIRGYGLEDPLFSPIDLVGGLATKAGGKAVGVAGKVIGRAASDVISVLMAGGLPAGPVMSKLGFKRMVTAVGDIGKGVHFHYGEYEARLVVENGKFVYDFIGKIPKRIQKEFSSNLDKLLGSYEGRGEVLKDAVQLIKQLQQQPISDPNTAKLIKQVQDVIDALRKAEKVK